MHLFHKGKTAFCFACLSILPTSILAAAPTPTDTVVVTASRVPLPSSAIGSSVSVITAEELEQKQTVFLADALRTVPGVSVNGNGTFGTLTEVRIRGGETNQTLVLIDGVEVNDPTTGAFDFGNLLTSDIERVEIIKGSQSALYGSDAAGGVINIITKKGSGTFKGRARAEVGRFDTSSAEFSASVGRENFAAFDFKNIKTNGISTFDDELGGTEADGHENNTFSFRGGLQLLPNWSLNGLFRNSNTITEIDFPFFETVEDQEDERTFFSVGTEFSAFEDTWVNKANIAYSETDSDFGAGFFSKGTRTKFDYQSTLHIATPAFANAEHSLTGAIESEKTRNLTPVVFVEQDRLAYVAEYNGNYFERLFVSLSGRYDQNDLFADEDTYRISIAYLFPASGSRLHTSYGTGATDPDQLDLFGFSATFIGNPDLTPERTRSFDIGLEQQLFGDTLTFDITYFQLITDDLIDTIAITDGSGGFISTTVNLPGTSEARGLEFSLTYQPLDAFTLTTTYTLTDTQDPDGNDLVRRPRNQGSVQANWALFNGRVNLNSNFTYHSGQADDDFVFFSGETIRLADRTVVDIGATYRPVDALEIAVRFTNIGNEQDQEVFGFGVPPAAFFTSLAYHF